MKSLAVPSNLDVELKQRERERAEKGFIHNHNGSTIILQTAVAMMKAEASTATHHHKQKDTQPKWIPFVLPPRCAVSCEDSEQWAHTERVIFISFVYFDCKSFIFRVCCHFFPLTLCHFFSSSSCWAVQTITKNQILWICVCCYSQHFLCIVSFIHFSLPILMVTFMTLFSFLSFFFFFRLFLPFHDDSFPIVFLHAIRSVSAQHSVCRRINAMVHKQMQSCVADGEKYDI